MIATMNETRSRGGRPSHPLDLEARDLMTPGVVSIAEDASLGQVYRALLAHRVHALLVIGRHGGRPLGWVTARGLLSWLDKDESLACARDAITQDPVGIEPGASGREAMLALSQPGVTHVLVQRAPDAMPEGVISTLNLVPAEFD
jgi:CBS domain-containing protein